MPTSNNSIYLWKIETVDPTTDTMIVEFIYEDKVTLLNLPLPDEGVDVSEWINRFAPRQQWQMRTVEPVVIGMTGEEFVVPVVPTPAPPPENQPPQTTGSFNEEYLRALIYQVLEEMQESTVQPPAEPPAEPPAAP